MYPSKLARTTGNRLGAFREDFDRLIDRLAHPAALTFDTAGLWSPDVDFSETDKEFVVRLELPGVTKDQVDVSLEGDVLTVRGERKSATEGEDERFVWREREEGSFLRSLRVPAPVDAAKVVATMDNGVLKIQMPKVTPAPSSRIPVK